MTLQEKIPRPDGGFAIRALHRSAGMLVTIEYDRHAHYLRQTAVTGLQGIESLEEYDSQQKEET